MAATADFSIEDGPDTRRLSARGAWLMASIGPLFSRLAALGPGTTPLEIDLGDVSSLDTGGAWLFYRTAKRLREAGIDVNFVNVRQEHEFLLDKVAENDAPCAVEPVEHHSWLDRVAHVGERAVAAGNGAVRGIGFTGLAAATLVRDLVHPSRFRFTSLVHHMKVVGFDALPIVGLITFLMGIVIAYMGATLLRPYGGEVFFTDLLGVVMLRELAVLLVAIIVAGRSGSAFTAQIGSMVLHEEVDAMRTLGLDPIEVLVVPRVLALIITLPILAFFGDLMGLLGGGLMAWVVLGTSPDIFLERLREAVGLDTFFVGVSRAPFFAAIIALAGCYEGLQVKGSAESVGYHTTKSVVEAIFMVIITTAAFSVFYLTIDV